MKSELAEKVWKRLLEKPNRLDLSSLSKDAYNFVVITMRNRQGFIVEEKPNQIILVYGWYIK